jgi:predicted nucleotidyltransferase
MNRAALLSGTEAGEAVLGEALIGYRALFGERLVAAYALGSLAHGGFSPLVSDVDLALLIADPLADTDPAAIAAVAERVRAAGSELHERLSVFWSTPGALAGDTPVGRFPPLDRLDLLEYGRLLLGRDVRVGMRRPDHAELVVGGAEFALDYLGDSTEQIRDPQALITAGTRRVTKVVLFPVRFLFTAATGAVGTNHTAVTWFLRSRTAPGAQLVEAAFGWRNGLPCEPAAAGDLLRRHLVPLYRHFIDDHLIRVAELGRPDLAVAFDEWATRIGR